MKTVAGVRFKEARKMYYFDPNGLTLAKGDQVIVETAQGLELGDVIIASKELHESEIPQPLKNIQRLAAPADLETLRVNKEKEKEAHAVCARKIAQHKLDMKLVDVEYSFNGSKVVFYFTADGRIDFRELVKDLASIFKMRIELRQIGVRDEAKILGGLGSCGLPCCCKRFLGEFQPVSIRMAKEQNLSLSPTKISGLCGRLMCCLKYEQDCYESMRKQMPRVNKEIVTPDGKGIVIENNILTERTKVRITLKDGSPEIREYPFRSLTRIKAAKNDADPPSPENEDAAPAFLMQED